MNKFVSRGDFSDQFRKVIIRYKRIESNINKMRQFACFVIYPITADNFASFSNCGSCVILHDGPNIKLVELLKLVWAGLSLVCCLLILSSNWWFSFGQEFQ